MAGAEKCRWPVSGETDGREVSDDIEIRQIQRSMAREIEIMDVNTGFDRRTHTQKRP